MDDIVEELDESQMAVEAVLYRPPVESRDPDILLRHSRGLIRIENPGHSVN